MEAAHRVCAERGDQSQQQIEARRLRREDVLAELLPVLERVDAREVDALVVVGVRTGEPAEQRRLRADKGDERKRLREPC